jgi:short-subunit dehydrogenase
MASSSFRPSRSRKWFARTTSAESGAYWRFYRSSKPVGPRTSSNVVSVAGTVAHGSSGPYAAAKHAQLAFSRATTVELTPRGIRVHTFNPGPVETPGFPQRMLLERPLVRRVVLTPERVAEAVIRSVEHDRAEVVVPRYLRLAGAAQALAPASLARLVSRAGGRAGALRDRGRRPR